MGRLKDKLTGLRIARACWNQSDAESEAMTKDDCHRMGCPYVDSDCAVTVLMDALDAVAQLEKKVKRLKKKGETET